MPADQVMFRLADALAAPQPLPVVASAPCQEVVESVVDLTTIPFLTHYASDAPTRKFSTQLLILILLLAVFGVVFDMLEISTNHPVLNPLFNIIDDGGELLVMSLIAAFLFDRSQNKTAPEPASMPA